MKFSVIIPAYNTEKYVKKCIDSVLMQSYKDYEVIIIDDCSTDKTLYEIKKYSEINNVKIFRNASNIGVSKTRNKGLELAKGEWVTFLDSDDWIEHDMLEKISDKINRYSRIDMIQSNLMVHESRGTHKYAELEEILVSEKKEIIDSTISVYYGNIKYGKYGNCRCVGGKFYRHEVLGNICFPEDLYTFEDGIFNLKVYLKADEILIIDDILYHYRRLSTSTTRRFNPDEENQHDKILKYIRKLIRNNKKYYESYTYCVYDFMVRAIYNFAGVKEYKNKVKNTKRILNKDRNRKALYNVKMRYLGKRYRMFYALARLRLSFLVYKIIEFIKIHIDRNIID